MRTKTFLTALTLALTGVATVAQAAVTVTFTKADEFIDMPFSQHERESVMTELQRHFEKLGGSLPAGQTLKIEVTEIDLAGRIEPNQRGGHDIRLLKGGADWPMIQLRYSLEANGKVLTSGEARVNDMNYLRSFNRYSRGESLRYEKAMLDNWYKSAIGVSQ